MSKAKPTGPGSALLSALKLDNQAFVDAIRAMVLKSDPASRAMCLVAYQNLGPLLAVFYYGRHTKGEMSLPGNLDEAISYMAIAVDEVQDDEVRIRRPLWLLLGALIMRASKWPDSNKVIQDMIADIWVSLAEAGPFIRGAIEHNIIWEPSEKGWFDNIKNERQAVWHVVEIMAPKPVRQHPKIKQLADKYDFLSMHRS